MKHSYGWKPDVPDQRDHILQATIRKAAPQRADVTTPTLPAYDQLALSSCTGNALSGAVSFLKPALLPSRLFIYYNERDMEHSVLSDSGASIRDGVKSLIKIGVCSEQLWPYDVNKWSVRPGTYAYTAASGNKIVSYKRIPRTLSSMRQCLGVDGFPFVFGFSVYDSFESDEVAHTGVVPLPARDEVMLGGHAVLAIGYDNTRGAMLCRNSWGPDWGLHGDFWLPYGYFLNPQLSSDFWTLRA